MMHRWLHRGGLAALAVAVACAPVRAQQTTPPAAPPAAAPAPAADSADVATPEAIVTAMYEVISGPASQERDWDRYRSLFLPNARMAFVLSNPANASQTRLFDLTVDEFIRLASPGYRTGAGFWERGVSHRVNRFGRIASVFSTYESRRTGPDGAVDSRGINSIQMLYDQGRWWVTNLVFDMEGPATQIPAEYLTPPGR